MTRPQELQFRVRRLVVDAAVLEQSGLSAETLPFALQQALQRREVGDTPEPSAANTVDRLAEAVWSQLRGELSRTQAEPGAAERPIGTVAGQP